MLLVALLLLIAGFLNDAPWKGFSSHQQIAVVTEPLRIAENLAREGEFANPFGAMPTGRTAHSAPGYPFFVFLILKSLGAGAAGWLALRCLATLALSLQFALLPPLARLLGYSAWTGVLASLFGLLVKPAKEEAHLAGLATLVLTAIAYRWMSRGSPPNTATVAGLTAGIACYIQPAILPVYLAWIVIDARSVGLFSKRVSPLWMLPLLLCAPWMIRNVSAIGSLAGMRDNLGIELNVSFNDCAPYGFRQSLERDCIPTQHPNSSAEEAVDVRRLGEYEYNRDRRRRAFVWIANHPERAAMLVAQRTWFFWFPSENGWRGYRDQHARTLTLHAMTLASILGLYLSFRKRIPSSRILTLWLTGFPLIYYVVQFDARYRYPILWVTWLMAAHCAGCVIEGLEHGRVKWLVIA